MGMLKYVVGSGNIKFSQERDKDFDHIISKNVKHLKYNKIKTSSLIYFK